MTDVRTTPPPASAASPSTDRLRGPVPRRLRPPRWLDLRLVLGVLLVLVSVLLGARVVGAADATVPVWAASGDLAAGTVLSAADLVAVDVRLDAAADRYLATSTRPEGRALARAVRGGELLPRSALEDVPALVQVALPVQAGYVPPALDRGQVVDVYAVADPAVGAAGRADGAVTLVVGAAPVQAVSGRTDGVLSSAATTVQVVVSVAAGDAPGVLAAIGGRPLVVVVHGSVDTALSSVGSSPPSAPTASAPTSSPTSTAAPQTSQPPTSSAPTATGPPSSAAPTPVAPGASSAGAAPGATGPAS